MNDRRQYKAAQPSLRAQMNQDVVLFAYQQDGLNWRTWTYRTVSRRKALQMEHEKEAYPLTREVNGQIVTMWRCSKPLRQTRNSPCTLTLSTMQAVAMDEPQAELTGGERAQVEKCVAWPTVWDGKNAATVGPAMTGAMQVRAQQMFDRARGVRRERRHKSRNGEVRTMHFAAAA